jgi:hypothetical protein
MGTCTAKPNFIRPPFASNQAGVPVAESSSDVQRWTNTLRLRRCMSEFAQNTGLAFPVIGLCESKG